MHNIGVQIVAQCSETKRKTIGYFYFWVINEFDNNFQVFLLVKNGQK